MLTMKQKQRQSGFTITELLITTALGLSVIGSILVGYLATYTSSMDTLAASKMNQDLNAVMNLMITEFRRAGYSGNAASATDPTTNVFQQIDNTALEVFDSMAGNTQMVPVGDGTWTNGSGATQGSCMVYAYDRDEDGVVDANELGGFRLNDGMVEMRTAGNTANPDTCSSTSANTWEALTDGDFITVSALWFNLDSSECLNTREPDNVDNDGDSSVDNPEEADCYDTPLPDAASGDITVETRQLNITLTGNLTNDSFVQISLNQNVRVRNDLVRRR
jgi:prepilin peptidase dependent protein B